MDRPPYPAPSQEPTPGSVHQGWTPPPPPGPQPWTPWQSGPGQPPPGPPLPGPIGYAGYQPQRRSNTLPMVIGGIVVAALGFVLIGAFITLGQGLGTFMEGSTLETLTVGQCFNGGRPEPSTEGTPLVGAVDMVDCDMPHESELVGTFVYPAAPAAEYPGTDIVGSYAEAECYLHFERYVGVPFARSRYELTYVTPLEFNWLMSDRSVQCVVHPPAGQEDMTGSVRGSSR